MPKRNSAWDKFAPLAAALLAAGCATPQYAVRGTPVPDESQRAISIEQQISAEQGKDFEKEGARPVGRDEVLAGFRIQPLVDRLSRVTERPGLPYRAYVYTDRDPNAAALADGRIYLSTGMLEYLRGRGGREDELAFIMSHELAHTVAQHLVKRYQRFMQQQVVMALIAAGASAVTRDATAGVQQAGRLATDAASLLADVANSGYSQDDELEADQLGIRYVIRAGFNPSAALDMLADFERFDNPWPFLRTHPYIAIRREYLSRYLLEQGQRPPASPAASVPARFAPDEATAARLRQLRQTQSLYPRDSVSWKNLQRQIDALEK